MHLGKQQKDQTSGRHWAWTIGSASQKKPKSEGSFSHSFSLRPLGSFHNTKSGEKYVLINDWERFFHLEDWEGGWETYLVCLKGNNVMQYYLATIYINMEYYEIQKEWWVRRLSGLVEKNWRGVVWMKSKHVIIWLWKGLCILWYQSKENVNWI